MKSYSFHSVCAILKNLERSQMRIRINEFFFEERKKESL